MYGLTSNYWLSKLLFTFEKYKYNFIAQKFKYAYLRTLRKVKRLSARNFELSILNLYVNFLIIITSIIENIKPLKTF